MTDTNREKWKRVVTRIGVWKPDVKCKLPCGDSDHYGRSSGNLWGHQQPRSNPCPDPSDPAMIVAMLDYLILKRGCALSHFDGLLSVEVPHANEMKYDKSKQIGIETDDTPESLHAALIDAIDALPQEARNG